MANTPGFFNQFIKSYNISDSFYRAEMWYSFHNHLYLDNWLFVVVCLSFVWICLVDVCMIYNILMFWDWVNWIDVGLLGGLSLLGICVELKRYLYEYLKGLKDEYHHPGGRGEEVMRWILVEKCSWESALRV